MTLLLTILLWHHYMYGIWSWHIYSYAFGFLIKTGCDRWAPPSCYPGISSCSVTITRIYVWEIGIRSNNIDTYWQRGNRYRKTQIRRRKSNNGNLPITDSVKISEENLQALLWLVRYWAWFASLLERVTHRLFGINFFIVCNSPPRLPYGFFSGGSSFHETRV